MSILKLILIDIKVNVILILRILVQEMLIECTPILVKRNRFLNYTHRSTDN